ncbi:MULTISPECIES: hypothetical protein [unclassified Tenacibaculum]|uniref:hypothetical protein n=1 Tax=unclassified Tenacibaculum TaxID=2635139 RepID=UPI001F400715|nr:MULTISPECIES: hypothetical protein [unclassified Tenacibaculum]MCF2873362.1 hypothetical protein [Tenacibaculum sp. Cn5-1]MCF2933518.1 hypothetical protein [Tenacibaculum sp. Cn5-34]MCG7509900.1 hypothetical protein [Tenacibaculum sp. Cn5-46]
MVKIYFYKSHLKEFNQISANFQDYSNIQINSSYYGINLIETKLDTNSRISQNSINLFIKYLNNNCGFKIMY